MTFRQAWNRTKSGQKLRRRKRSKAGKYIIYYATKRKEESFMLTLPDILVNDWYVYS